MFITFLQGWPCGLFFLQSPLVPWSQNSWTNAPPWDLNFSTVDCSWNIHKCHKHIARKGKIYYGPISYQDSQKLQSYPLCNCIPYLQRSQTKLKKACLPSPYVMVHWVNPKFHLQPFYSKQERKVENSLQKKNIKRTLSKKILSFDNFFIWTHNYKEIIS